MNQLNTYRKTDIQTADPAKVVVLLYEGAINNLNRTIAHLEGRSVEQDWTARMNKSLSIIHFLTQSLNFEDGGEIAPKLYNLYNYIRDIVTRAGIKKDPEPMKEGVKLLTEVLVGWRGISNGVEAPAPGPVRVPTPPESEQKPLTYGAAPQARAPMAITA